MADSAVILNNFRAAFQILHRNVQRAVASHEGDDSVLDVQRDEVIQFFRAAEVQNEVFPPEENASLQRSVERMIQCLCQDVVDSEERTCTEMHRTWGIREIVQEIISHFDSMDLPARAQLACLARTSRIFHEQVLDALWKHMRTMVNLIKCMPSDLWEARTIQGQFIMTGTECCTTPTASNPSLFDSDLERTCRRPISATKPGVGCFNDQMAPAHLSLFITPRLRDLRLSTFHASLFPSLTQLPDLQSVSVPRQSLIPEAQQQISALIRGLRNLQSLQVDTPFADLAVLVHLGKLRSLTTLQISPMPAGPYSAMYDQDLFSNLLSVDLHFTESDQLPGFILTMATTPSEQVLRAVFEALSERVDPKSLCTLSVKHMHRVRERRDALTGDIFKSLVSFVNLNIVCILTSDGYKLDDVLMGELARAWPHLMDLKLQTTWNDHRQASLITLLSLRTLASHCPQLRFLELTFDATSTPTVQPQLGPSNERMLHFDLFSLNAAHSPISSAIDVARYLSALFPRLAGVRGAYDHYAEEEVETEEERAEVKWSALWREVQALLPVLNDIRGEEYEWGRQSIHLCVRVYDV
ncbi:hypothetical protein FB45DRAFT_999700 [Roridomyces roridus]|uniref:F-box domain-containing protein n=1 Tax=Roridomyces roridus TaxID=1738132 RepID=A0AAD7FV64_9AGAR|nr:hypothetical protein FB45DRAFT_999700 [Roridomyces roridus]